MTLSSPTLAHQKPRTLLAILVENGVLRREQAALLPPAADNAAAEELLTSKQLVGADDILQAYAKLYRIPFIHLKNTKIKNAVINAIPEIIARRYDIVAYDRERDIIFVAVASPGRLKGGQQEGLLHRLQRELKIKIAPAFAPLTEIRLAHGLYHRSVAAVEPVVETPASFPKSGVTKNGQSIEEALTKIQPPPKQVQLGSSEIPQVSLIDAIIDPAILKKFPREIAAKYKLIPFASEAANQLSVATLDYNNPVIKQLVEFIEKRNGIKVSLYQTDESSLTHALLQYEQAPVTAEAVRQASVASLSAVEKKLNQKVQPLERPSGNSQNNSPDERATLSTTTPEIRAEEIASSTEQFSPLQADLVQKTGQPNLSPQTEAKTKDQNDNKLDAFLERPLTSVRDLVELVKLGNIPKTIAGIVALAVDMRASDIHIEASKDKIRLRYRVDGELEDILVLPHALLAPLVSRVKILSQMKIDENRIPQDGRFDVHYRAREIDLRISTLPTVHGEKVVMRILDKTTGIMSLEDMGFDDANLKRLIVNIEKPYGIILATGPTGSGKSTTLYAILQRIAKPEVNVVTLEDPVEYEIKGINQTQIKPKIGFTFAEGLRSILRQDPNIIMVGEIRDKETAEMATHSALTGHLVLSTLHTNTAAGALPRLINMGVEPFLITSSINAIIGQRLVRRICPKCKEKAHIPEGVIEEIKADLMSSNIPEQFKDPASWQFLQGKGCQECTNGYRGRIGIFEVLAMTDEIEALAVKKEPASVLEQQALKEGMITMKQDGLVKALKGYTTLEEVMKATTE